MTMQRLIGEEPIAYLIRQTSPNATNDSMLPLHTPAVLETIQGRLVLANASQIKAWSSLGIEASYTFISFNTTVKNGDYIKTSDNRLFRVISGAGERVYGKGRIPSYRRYALQEESRT